MKLGTLPLQQGFGLEVRDIDLAVAGQPAFEAIRQLWQRAPLLLFRRQSLTEDELLNFSRCFGTLDVNIGGTAPSERNPEILCVSNLMRQDGTAVGGLSNDELVWHTDQIYRERPASGSIFMGVEMPDGAGMTSFCNMAAAYDALPDDLKTQVDGKRAVCKYGARNPLSTFMASQTEKTFRRNIESEDDERRSPGKARDPVPVCQVLSKRGVLEHDAADLASLDCENRLRRGVGTEIERHALCDDDLAPGQRHNRLGRVLAPEGDVLEVTDA